MENNKYILSYDLNMLPPNWDLNTLYDCIKNTNIVFYDSRNKGIIPKVIKLNKKVTLEIKDINN